MARGWESKSVEEQIGEQVAEQQGREPVVAPKDTSRERRRRELELQREHVLNQRTSNPQRRAALAQALEEIEASLREVAG